MGIGEIMAKKQKEKKKKSWLSYFLLAVIPLILSVTIIYIVLSLLGMEPVKNTKNFLNRVPGVEKLITTEEEMNIETMEAAYLAQIGDYQSQINRLMMESTEKDDEIEALERDIVDLNNQLAEYQSQIVSQNEQQARLEVVVSTYSDMEPESAARILSETTTVIAVDILNGVPSEARSEILSFMEAEKAAELTELLYQ
jgi:flagellar motility protein MotE (MotC chaperone)